MMKTWWVLKKMNKFTTTIKTNYTFQDSKNKENEFTSNYAVRKIYKTISGKNRNEDERIQSRLIKNEYFSLKV